MEEVPSGDVVATVFGATGHVGRYTVNFLAKTGAQVIYAYRGEERYHSHLRVNGEVGQVVPIRWTLHDKEAIRMAVEQSQIVVNLSGAKGETRHFNFHQANVESAVNIAEACKKAGVERLIQISAVGADLDSASGFLKSKAEAEKAVKEIFPAVTIVRITTPFGRLDKFFHRFGFMANRSPIFLLLADPNTRIQPVYAQDVAQALAVISYDPRTKGKTFELGGPDTLTWDQFSKFILTHTKYDGMKPIIKINPTSYLAKAISTAMSYSRSKIWTPEELLYHQNDIVVNPDALTFKDLNIKPRSLQQATDIFQLYKSKLRS